MRAAGSSVEQSSGSRQWPTMGRWQDGAARAADKVPIKPCYPKTKNFSKFFVASNLAAYKLNIKYS